MSFRVMQLLGHDQSRPDYGTIFFDQSSKRTTMVIQAQGTHIKRQLK